MSYPDPVEPKVIPVFDSMMKQHLVKSSLFAFYLTENNDGIESDITFGYYDRTKFTGNIVWHPVIGNREFFIIKLDDLKVGGKSLGLCGKNGLMKKDCLVTVDSGSSTFAASGSFYRNLHKLGVGTHTNPVDCSNLENMKLTYVINGIDYEIDPLDYLVGPVTRAEAADVQPYLAELSKSSLRLNQQKPKKVHENGPIEYPDSDKICFGLIMQIDIENDMFILGDIFMRKYYSIFDRSKNRVGLALSK
jgi:cathepsin D